MQKNSFKSSLLSAKVICVPPPLAVCVLGDWNQVAAKSAHFYENPFSIKLEMQHSYIFHAALNFRSHDNLFVSNP